MAATTYVSIPLTGSNLFAETGLLTNFVPGGANNNGLAPIDVTVAAVFDPTTATLGQTAALLIDLTQHVNNIQILLRSLLTRK